MIKTSQSHGWTNDRPENVDGKQMRMQIHESSGSDVTQSTTSNVIHCHQNITFVQTYRFRFARRPNLHRISLINGICS